ncbi:MAG: DUF7676 family protein [Arenicellales bacterium]
MMRDLIDLPDYTERNSSGYTLLFYDIDCHKKLTGSETPVSLTPQEFQEIDDEDLGPLLGLFRALFTTYFEEIEFGPIIGGVVYELRLNREPASMKVHDGYLTVAFHDGFGHFHICCGKSEANELLGRSDRRIKRAALYRGLDMENRLTGTGGLRCWNGADQQMINIFLRGKNGPQIVKELIARFCFSEPSAQI